MNERCYQHRLRWPRARGPIKADMPFVAHWVRTRLCLLPDLSNAKRASHADRASVTWDWHGAEEGFDNLFLSAQVNARYSIRSRTRRETRKNAPKWFVWSFLQTADARTGAGSSRNSHKAGRRSARIFDAGSIMSEVDMTILDVSTVNHSLQPDWARQ